MHFAASLLREAAALTTQITGEIIPADKPGVLAMAVRQPAGVVLGIAPWNAPVILGVRAIATPLACGNTVILKASEVCPATHRLIGEVLSEAGLPEGVVNVITNAPEDAAEDRRGADRPPGRQAGELHRLDRGSAGSSPRLARQHLKPVLLELGGKAPLVVLDDADLDDAVNAAVFGAFANQGQICMSTERHRSSTRRSPTPSSRSSPSAPRRCPPAIRAAMSCSARWSASRPPSAWTN